MSGGKRLADSAISSRSGAGTALRWWWFWQRAMMRLLGAKRGSVASTWHRPRYPNRRRLASLDSTAASTQDCFHVPITFLAAPKNTGVQFGRRPFCRNRLTNGPSRRLMPDRASRWTGPYRTTRGGASPPRARTQHAIPGVVPGKLYNPAATDQHAAALRRQAAGSFRASDGRRLPATPQKPLRADG